VAVVGVKLATLRTAWATWLWSPVPVPVVTVTVGVETGAVVGATGRFRTVGGGVMSVGVGVAVFVTTGAAASAWARLLILPELGYELAVFFGAGGASEYVSLTIGMRRRAVEPPSRRVLCGAPARRIRRRVPAARVTLRAPVDIETADGA